MTGGLCVPTMYKSEGENMRSYVSPFLLRFILSDWHSIIYVRLRVWLSNLLYDFADPLQGQELSEVMAKWTRVFAHIQLVRETARLVYHIHMDLVPRWGSPVQITGTQGSYSNSSPDNRTVPGGDRSGSQMPLGVRQQVVLQITSLSVSHGIFSDIFIMPVTVLTQSRVYLQPAS